MTTRFTNAFEGDDPFELLRAQERRIPQNDPNEGYVVYCIHGHLRPTCLRCHLFSAPRRPLPTDTTLVIAASDGVALLRPHTMPDLTFFGNMPCKAQFN